MIEFLILRRLSVYTLLFLSLTMAWLLPVVAAA